MGRLFVYRAGSRLLTLLVLRGSYLKEIIVSFLPKSTAYCQSS
jgi:hypothetical protein